MGNTKTKIKGWIRLFALGLIIFGFGYFAVIAVKNEKRQKFVAPVSSTEAATDNDANKAVVPAKQSVAIPLAVIMDARAQFNGIREHANDSGSLLESLFSDVTTKCKKEGALYFEFDYSGGPGEGLFISELPAKWSAPKKPSVNVGYVMAEVFTKIDLLLSEALVVDEEELRAETVLLYTDDFFADADFVYGEHFDNVRKEFEILREKYSVAVMGFKVPFGTSVYNRPLYIVAFSRDSSRVVEYFTALLKKLEYPEYKFAWNDPGMNCVEYNFTPKGAELLSLDNILGYHLTKKDMKDDFTFTVQIERYECAFWVRQPGSFKLIRSIELCTKTESECKKVPHDHILVENEKDIPGAIFVEFEDQITISADLLKDLPNAVRCVVTYTPVYMSDITWVQTWAMDSTLKTEQGKPSLKLDNALTGEDEESFHNQKLDMIISNAQAWRDMKDYENRGKEIVALRKTRKTLWLNRLINLESFSEPETQCKPLLFSVYIHLPLI